MLAFGIIMDSPFVFLDQASLIYGDPKSGTLALDGVTLAVPRGNLIGIVGPSGCGKSSLLKVVSGLAKLASGSVTVGGKKVYGPLKIVGMAFQNPIMLPWRTTLQNVMLPLEIVEPHRFQLRREYERYAERAKELLATVGIAEFADKHPWQLSGGMQQRASLCRALIHEPELLLLDEPFASLDAFTREELWTVLQKLWMKRPFTVILITHELREAVFLSDAVHVMSTRPGKIIASYDVSFPRPRLLEDTFRTEFVGILRDIRSRITQERMK